MCVSKNKWTSEVYLRRLWTLSDSKTAQESLQSFLGADIIYDPCRVQMHFYWMWPDLWPLGTTYSSQKEKCCPSEIVSEEISEPVWSQIDQVAWPASPVALSGQYLSYQLIIYSLGFQIKATQVPASCAVLSIVKQAPIQTSRDYTSYRHSAPTPLNKM